VDCEGGARRDLTVPGGWSARGVCHLLCCEGGTWRASHHLLRERLLADAVRLVSGTFAGGAGGSYVVPGIGQRRSGIVRVAVLPLPWRLPGLPSKRHRRGGCGGAVAAVAAVAARSDFLRVPSQSVAVPWRHFSRRTGEPSLNLC
jgi:hypothetical protein